MIGEQMIYVDIILSIAPIFLLIIIGYGLRRYGFSSAEFWNFTNKLVYWILFPALLFSKTSTIVLSGDKFLSNAVVIYGGFGSAVVFALLVGKIFQFNGATLSSVLQGAARHNAFIALAVAERLFGSQGLAQAALVTAMLIPVTNIVVVTLMVVVTQSSEQKGVVRAILRDLARNPLLIAVLLGVGMNILGVTPLPVVNDLTDILGRAALPIMLVAVGANIRVRKMANIGLPTFFSVVGKMVVFPAVIAILALSYGLSELATMVAIIFGSVPTAASAYALARQMGGDAQLMSTIITIQTGLSFVSLPISLAIVQQLVN
jgi:predicted permease